MARRDATAAGRLEALLQLAHSGELAAALAYRGHQRSVSDDDERRRIRTIEDEEWHHRRLLREMLAELGAAPSRYREARAGLIGRALGVLCRLSGWMVPMYGAGRLESRNIREYELAARLAWACGRHEWIERLLGFAEVEWEHEAYFRARVLNRRLGRRLPIWPAPPPKASIRTRFERERAERAPAAPNPSARRASSTAVTPATPRASVAGP